MVKRLSSLEMLFKSTVTKAFVSLFRDLPYVNCTFFFGEPEYPSDNE